MRKFLSAVASICAIVFFSGAAKSQERAVAYSVWSIAVEEMNASYDIRKGDNFLDLRLIPERIIRINNNVVDVGTSGVKATVGGQYLKYRLEDQSAENGFREVYCSSKTLDYMKSGGSVFYFRYNGTFLCLVDTDKDDRFDGVYEVRSSLGSGLPIITHGRLGEYEVIEPVSFETIASEDFDNPISLQLEWVSGNGLDDRLILQPVFDSEFGDPLRMEYYVGLNEGEVPGRFSFLNLRFEASSERRRQAHLTVEQGTGTPVLMVRGSSASFSVL